MLRNSTRCRFFLLGPKALLDREELDEAGSQGVLGIIAHDPHFEQAGPCFRVANNQKRTILSGGDSNLFAYGTARVNDGYVWQVVDRCVHLLRGVPQRQANEISKRRLVRIVRVKDCDRWPEVVGHLCSTERGHRRNDGQASEEQDKSRHEAPPIKTLKVKRRNSVAARYCWKHSQLLQSTPNVDLRQR